MHIRSYMLSNTSILSNILVGTLGRSVRKMFIVCKVLFRTFDDIQKKYNKQETCETLFLSVANETVLRSRFTLFHVRDSLTLIFAIVRVSESR